MLCLHMEKYQTQIRWLLLWNIFKISKLNLVLLCVELLFCERSLKHHRCFILWESMGKTTVTVVRS